MKIERFQFTDEFDGIIAEAEEVLGRLDQESGEFEYMNIDDGYMTSLDIKPNKAIIKGQPVSHQWVDVYTRTVDFETQERGIIHLVARMHYK